MPTYPLTPLVESLPATVPFVGPETQERARGEKFAARIGANESVFGPSPKAIEAIAAAAQDVWQYGDPEVHELRTALAKHHGVRPENIVVGEGIDGLLGYLVRMLIEPGTAVATSFGAYPTFNFHVTGYGGRLVTVPYREDHEDPDALITLARTEKARLIYFANPDNPMGTWHDGAVVSDLIAAVPEGAILCLDEAYGDFAPVGTMPPIDVENPKVLRFRTFSKAQGLAGLRVGYAVGEAGLINQFNKIRNHFGVGRVAQAGALAALTDPGHLASVLKQADAARNRIAEIATANGLSSLPSATNFVAVDCGRDGAFARAVLDGLVARGVFVRMPGVAPLNRCIRVSVGRPEHLDLLEKTLPEALRDAALATAA